MGISGTPTSRPEGPEGPRENGAEGAGSGPSQVVLAVGMRPGVATAPGPLDRLCWLVPMALVVLFSHENVLLLAGVSGFVVASAMYAWERLPRSEAVVGLIAVCVAAFVTGGFSHGGVITCGALAGAAYGRLIGVTRSEDDHFFLGTGLPLVAVAVFAAVASLLPAGWVDTPFEAVHRALASDEMRDAADQWRRMFGLKDVRLARAALAGLGTVIYSLTLYLPVLWVRRRLWGVWPGRGRLMDFRIGLRYSPLVIAVLAGFVVAPYAERWHLEAMVLPVACWLGTAAFLGGLGFFRHVRPVAADRFAGCPCWWSTSACSLCSTRARATKW